MKTASELRAEGRAALQGKWLQFALFTFVYMVIVELADIPNVIYRFSTMFDRGTSFSALSFLPVISYILVLVLLPLMWGFQVAFLSNRRYANFDNFGSLFDGFKDFQRIFTTTLLMYVYIFLWTLLLIIPGIVKSISYSMTPYILKDNPELDNNRAIERSMTMMEGHKMDYFILQLTFIGWGLLSILTCGIGFLFLIPYMQSSTAAFYENLLDETYVD